MNVTAVLVLFRKLRVIDAIDALTNHLDAALDPVFIGGEKVQVVDMFNMTKEYPRVAEHFPLRFYGGPEGSCRWYNGSLLTLFVDRLLSAQFEGREAAVDAVMKMGDTLAIKN